VYLRDGATVSIVVREVDDALEVDPFEGRRRCPVLPGRALLVVLLIYAL